MTQILDLSLRGAAVTALVLVLDLALGRWLAARHRRLLWLLVPFAFLLPVSWKLPVLPARAPAVSAEQIFKLAPSSRPPLAMADPQRFRIEVIFLLWAAGFVAGAGVVAVRTVRASRRWDASRFSTDGALLEALEDCRNLAGVSTPVGVVVSEGIESPALLGWLRPKLLLPAKWLGQCTPTQLRDVLLHELAHLRRADLAWGWLFTALRLVHWFNPFAHLAVWRWRAAREDAADEFVLRLRAKAPGSYDETLLAFLKC